MALTMHWRMLKGGETEGETRGRGEELARTGLPDLPAQLAFCRQAEALGFHGLLVDIGAANPDPLLLSAGLGLGTSTIELIVACRSGLWHPTTFVQQLNTLAALVGGRVSLNVVAGHSPYEQGYYGDFLGHDERYARTEEFLAICHALWRGGEPLDFEGRYYRVVGAKLNTPFVGARPFPEIFVAGGSTQARDLAISQGTCWMRLADRPEAIAAAAAPVLAAGKQVGLRMSIICRPTRAEALAAARALVAGLDRREDDSGRESKFVQESDSISIRSVFELAADEWLTPTLWSGAVRSHGAPAMALVGSPDEVAAGLLELGRAGVSHFILSGWPKLAEMTYFGEAVLPRIRAAEQA
jgi:alkanesulfonate monooxygenase